MKQNKTKIIATLGPATFQHDRISQLIHAGVNTFRLNFSHGHHEMFAELIKKIRSISEQHQKPVALLGDLQGPKIRVGSLEGESLMLKNNDIIFIESSTEKGGVIAEQKVIRTPYKEFVEDVGGNGHRILLDDGLIEMESIKKNQNQLVCRVLSGGTLLERKGINVPSITFSTPSITEKDYADMLFCVEHDFDYIALSFVRSAQEVRSVRQFLDTRKSELLILSKIEMSEAIDRLTEIIEVSDGVLVARGDLAVEVGNERVPLLQKKIVKEANLQGKITIIATQMLMSMVHNPRPSRAEASDIANAVLDQTDATMLSNETAVGEHPIESVKMMQLISADIDKETFHERITHQEWQLTPNDEAQMAVLQSAVRLAAITNSKALVVMSRSGISPRLISKCRPHCPIFAVTEKKSVYHQMCLIWGVIPLFVSDMSQLIEKTLFFDAVSKKLTHFGLVDPGDKLVMTAGLPHLKEGSTNTIKVHIV